MNWGSNINNGRIYTQTASLISAYISEPTGSTNVTSLYDNINSGYVEIINTKSLSKVTTRGQAFKETAGWYDGISYSGTHTGFPISVRYGLFGFSVSYSVHQDSDRNSTGAENNNATYRVVFWN